MATMNPHSDGVFLGRGRSAMVYKLNDGSDLLARKVFTGSSAANLVHLLFYGAPMDYSWCPAAIEAAYYRRKVLQPLLQFWFGGQLTIADSVWYGIDPEHRCYYLDTRFVAGRPARLYSPFLSNQRTEISHLKETVLPQLQGHLNAAGLIGTLWQAGKGQPCAFPNFLCTRLGQNGDDHCWTWVDTESGVPAIVSYHLPSLIKIYLPQALKRRRVLFDDLDADQFKAYLAQNRQALEESLGPAMCLELTDYGEKLMAAHSQWSRECRLSRSLKFCRFQGMIDDADYVFYRLHPFRWYRFLLGRLVCSLPLKAIQKLRQAWPNLSKWLNPMPCLLFLFGSLFSSAYRTRISRRYVQNCIQRWYDLRRLTEDQKLELERQLSQGDACNYLADFGVHLGLKPLGYLLRFTLVPLLWKLGLISLATSGILFVFMGNILRTGYALWRCIQCAARREPLPLTALMISMIPSLGSLAFPCQMLHTARKGHLVSQMIIYESFSSLAAKLPIWGGRDTGWDHLLNRLAHRLIGMTWA